ncbi:MAG: nucleoside hydrolase [Gemmatales bacterium]|nr:MAG: nucleoside hydrolase [Gemmatales bacterium]
MPRKIAIIADPGIDTAFALTLALFDPELEVLGIGATAGNIGYEQATRNVQIVVEQIDPPRWPRLGAALPIDYDIDATYLHGPGGLGGVEFPCANLLNQITSDRLLIDLIQLYPKEVTIVCLGPLTAVASALERDPELPFQVQQLICMGGAWRVPGDASAVAEFHFYCDPLAARQVLKAGMPITMIPLDASRNLLFSPTDLHSLPGPGSRRSQFLQKIIPPGIGATSSALGIEGLHLNDVMGILAASKPEILSSKPMVIDVETRGELTRGMSVIDPHRGKKEAPNVELVVDVEMQAAREYISSVLGGRS